MNLGKAIDMIEMLAKQAGVDEKSIDKELIVDLINLKLSEMYGETLQSMGVFEGATVSATHEYDLPVGVVPFTVELDGGVIDPVNYTTAFKWRYND